MPTPSASLPVPTHRSDRSKSSDGVQPHPSPLVWKRSIYLPLEEPAKKGFQAYERRLRKRLRKKPALHRVWGVASPLVAPFMTNATTAIGEVPVTVASEGEGRAVGSTDFSWGAAAVDHGNSTVSDVEVDVYRALLLGVTEPHRIAQRVQRYVTQSGVARAPPLSRVLCQAEGGGASHVPDSFLCQCLREVPECEFFIHVGTVYLSMTKCCSEHMKLQRTLRDFFQAARQDEELWRQRLFLDSGTLLSSIRDGGDTLLPWETDVDIGLVGAEPHHAQRWNQSALNERHHLEVCAVSAVDHACKDAHYVYAAENAVGAREDTCRVEIWPFATSASVPMLYHPTRPWLSVPPSMVLPLRPCRIWGMEASCPLQSESVLDIVYGGRSGWLLPRTIHWGEKNIPAWGENGKGTR